MAEPTLTEQLATIVVGCAGLRGESPEVWSAIQDRLPGLLNQPGLDRRTETHDRLRETQRELPPFRPASTGWAFDAGAWRSQLNQWQAWLTEVLAVQPELASDLDGLIRDMRSRFSLADLPPGSSGPPVPPPGEPPIVTFPPGGTDDRVPGEQPPFDILYGERPNVRGWRERITPPGASFGDDDDELES